MLNTSAILAKSSLTDYLINSNNENYLIFISLLKDKIYQLYIEFNIDLENEEQENENNLILYPKEDETIQDINFILLWTISRFARWLIELVKYIPGLNVLSEDDLDAIISEHVYFIYAIERSKYFDQNTGDVVLENKTILSYECLKKLNGKEKTDLMVKFWIRFNKLDLTTKEKALLYPFVLCSSGK